MTGFENAQNSGLHKYFMEINKRNEGEIRTESETSVPRPANWERRVETIPSDRQRTAATVVLQKFAGRPTCTLRRHAGKEIQKNETEARGELTTAKTASLGLFFVFSPTWKNVRGVILLQRRCRKEN